MKHVKAVIFDWAGTVVDYGSLAPMGAFVETFAEFGVEISIDEARGPMGMAKRPHIAALTASPRIAEAWERRHDRAPTEADIDALYEVFVPKNVAVAAAYAEVIPGVAEVVKQLRAEGVKTQLVVYPNEGHGFTNPQHIRDRTEREVRWFAENMLTSK